MAAIRIGDLLLSKGILSQKQLGIALLQQRITGDLLGDALIKLGFTTARELAQTLAEQSGFGFVDLREYTVSEEALKLVHKNIADKTEFIPLDVEDGKLVIGITNPSNILAVDTVAKMTGSQPKVFMVDTGSFHDALESAYFFLENPIQERLAAIVSDIKETGTAAGGVISNLTELLVMDAIRKNATDVHIYPGENITHVFYRIDGVMQYGHAIPRIAHTGVSSRIKILSHLDIAEQRLPQDGSYTFTFLNKKYDIRVSTVPSIYGENIVMRVLAGTGDLPKLEDLGFDEENTARIKGLFHKPYGIILITGPTGSGKTTTLYAALKEINLLERNVVTIEDPVEYKVNFIRQTQVNEKVGYDFALAGRNFMRQDPDVMLLGEIRDEETAKIAVRASITGHLVISTLHSNDTVTSIPRLIDLNVDRFLLSTSILAIMTQRLVRKLCPFCRTEYALTGREIEAFREFGLAPEAGFRGKGCKKCGGGGYLGRTVIGEILIVDDDIKELIYSGASVVSIKETAVKKGMIPLKAGAMAKAAAGITTLEEAVRVAG